MSEKKDKNNKRHQEPGNWNVESYSGDTTIRNGGKWNSGPDNQTRTDTVSPCRDLRPNNSKPSRDKKNKVFSRLGQDSQIISSIII